MTNEMKLLRAFIDASGFDVEEIRLKIKPDDLVCDGFTETMYNTAGTVDGYYLGIDIHEYKVTKKPIKPKGNQFSEGDSNEYNQ